MTDMAAYMRDRYKQRKAKAIALLGGKCVKCQTTENLEFDHVDPANKSFVVTVRMDSRPWEQIEAELAKCQLLCRECHARKSAEDSGKSLARGTHGTLSSWRYCKCDVCREAYRAYMRVYMAQRRANKKTTPV